MVETDQMPLERVMRIAEFRADLRTFLRHSEQECRRWDLTPRRYLLLLSIKGAPNGEERQTFSELTDRMKLSKNAVTDLVARAESVGLVWRERSSDDRRVVYLRLTAEGERRLSGVLAATDSYRHDLSRAFQHLKATFPDAA